MDVDKMMGWATRAVERVFGKDITYSVTTGLGALSTTATWSFRANFIEHAEAVGVGAMVNYQATMPALDVRKTALDTLGIWPVAGARVTFSVHDEARTYRVTSVKQPGPDSVMIFLGERE